MNEKLENKIVEGINKYIQIEKDGKTFVIAKNEEWHKTIYSSIADIVDESNVAGGGFLKVDDSQKTIVIFGRSGSYGVADENKVKQSLEDSFSEYKILTYSEALELELADRKEFLNSEKFKKSLDMLGLEARLSVLYKNIMQDKFLPEHYINEVIEGYQKRGFSTNAAYVAEKIGNLELAIDIWEKAGLRGNAIDIAERAGFNERAKELYNDQIDILEKEENFLGAINLAERAGFNERVKELSSKQIEIYEEQERFTPAANLAKRAGFNERAKKLYDKQIDIYVKKEDFLEAGRFAESVGQSEKAFSCFMKAGKYEASLRIAKEKGWDDSYINFAGEGLIHHYMGKIANITGEEIQMDIWRSEVFNEFTNSVREYDLFELAVDELSSYGNYKYAVRMAKEGGLDDKVQELHNKELDIYESKIALQESEQRYSNFAFLAAKIAKEAGLDERAQELYNKQIDIYVKIEEFNDAAQVAQESGDLERSVDLYIKAEKFNEAASVARKAELFDKSIKIYEQQGKFADAAQVAQESGDLERSVDLYIKAEKFNDAAQLVQESGDLERSVDLYIKAEKFNKAASVARKAGLFDKSIKIYEQQGKFADAAQVAQESGDLEQAKLYDLLYDFMK